MSLIVFILMGNVSDKLQHLDTIILFSQFILQIKSFYLKIFRINGFYTIP